jgi:hypothetical protein
MNYNRYVACERRAQYLEDPEHQGVLREDIVGERGRGAPEGAGLGEEAQFDVPEEIQGHRELVDASEALGKAKRDASMRLPSTSTQKERATISSVEASEAEQRE